jgi:hypothetical protein
MTPTPTESAPAAPVADVTDYQRQIDELKSQVAESQRTAQFWADRAASGGPPTTPPPPDDDGEDDDTDVLEAITTKGTKGFDDLASKRGFIKRADVEQIVAARAESLTKEQNLLNEYPALKDKTTDFFKSTAQTYGALRRQNVPEAVAMEQAARTTELEFLRAGKMKLPNAEPTADEKEARRLRRIAAQSGPTGSTRPAAADDEDDNELTPQQKHICDLMGVSYEAYAKRAKAGVNMKGIK